MISAETHKFPSASYKTLQLSAMYLRNVFYLLLLLQAGPHPGFGSESKNKRHRWLDDLRLETVGKRVESTMQLPIFAKIGLYLSPFIGNAEAATYEPVLPPSYPLAVRSPYLSGLSFPKPSLQSFN